MTDIGVNKGSSKRTVALETITREIALSYLDKNHHNPRPRNKNYVEGMARAMLRNTWYLSNDALIFDINGDFRNGQHRMRALLLAAKKKENIALEFIVGRGFTEKDIEKMDRGIPRSMLRVVQQYCYDITKKDISVYSSMLRDVFSRNRLLEEETVDMHSLWGNQLHILNTTDTDFYSQAFIKKAALLAIIADPSNADYVQLSYEHLVKYGSGKPLPESASPAIKSFTGIGRVRTNTRTAQYEVAAYARHAFTYKNRYDDVKAIKLGDAVLSLRKESKKVYEKAIENGKEDEE